MAMASKPASDERRKFAGASASSGSSAARRRASAAGTVRPAMSAAETRKVTALTR